MVMRNESDPFEDAVNNPDFFSRPPEPTRPNSERERTPQLNNESVATCAVCLEEMPRKSRKRRYHPSCAITAKRWRRIRRNELGLLASGNQIGCIACGEPLDYVRSDDWYCSNECAVWWRNKRIKRQQWHNSRCGLTNRA